jgi:hypothetical protein
MSAVIGQLSPLVARALLAGAVVSCLLLPACSRAPSRAEVPGAYQATYPFGHEALLLRQDGSYSQEITIKAKGDTDAVYRATGVWQYGAPDVWPRETFVDFDSNFLIVFDQWGEQAPQPRTLRRGGISAFRVERMRGNVRILGASEKPYAVYSRKGTVESSLKTHAR